VEKKGFGGGLEENRRGKCGLSNRLEKEVPVRQRNGRLSKIHVPSGNQRVSGGGNKKKVAIGGRYRKF